MWGDFLKVEVVEKLQVLNLAGMLKRAKFAQPRVVHTEKILFENPTNTVR